MSLPFVECPRCCTHTGYPRGLGSQWVQCDGCGYVIGLRLRATRRQGKKFATGANVEVAV